MNCYSTVAALCVLVWRLFGYRKLVYGGGTGTKFLIIDFPSAPMLKRRGSLKRRLLRYIQTGRRVSSSSDRLWSELVYNSIESHKFKVDSLYMVFVLRVYLLFILVVVVLL